MTTSTRMNNFKRMAERFSREGKLLTAFDKTLKPQVQLEVSYHDSNLPRIASHLIRLVLKPSKKANSH